MVKKNKFWTPTKVIVTILITIVLFFILFKLGLFGSAFDNLLSTSSSNTPSADVLSMSGGGLK